MLSHRKRSITVVDLDGPTNTRAFKRRRIGPIEHDTVEIDPEKDLKEFHLFEKLPLDIKKDIFTYFGEVELMGLARTSKQFYDLQKSLIHSLLASMRLTRLKATRADPSDLSAEQIEDRIGFIKAQMRAHEKEAEAIKQELKRTIFLKIENPKLTTLQKFDIWRQPDVPKTFHRYIVRGIQPVDAQDLWKFFEQKHTYGFAERREEMPLEKIVECLQDDLNLEYDRQRGEWTGASADLELFAKYAAKLMLMDYGGCYWDW